MRITTRSPQETLALGRLIGLLAPPPPATTIIALDGALGAGKTHLTRGIAQGAGITDPSLVSSPTFVLLNIYPGAKPVYHLDAYRITSPADFEALGLEELLAGGGIVVIEWAEKMRELLPPDYLHIQISHEDNGAGALRSFVIQGIGLSAEMIVQKLPAFRTTPPEP